MPIKKPENTVGPFAIRASGTVTAEDGTHEVSALVGTLIDGPTELGEEEKPRSFNTIEQAEKWLNHNASEVALQELDWEIITTTEALTMREDLKLDEETKKFI